LGPSVLLKSYLVCRSDVMPVDEKQLMRRWFQEVWNEGKAETIHELLAPDAVAIGQLEDRKELRGAADFVPFVKTLRSAFPDVKMTVEDILPSAALAADERCPRNGMIGTLG